MVSNKINKYKNHIEQLKSISQISIKDKKEASVSIYQFLDKNKDGILTDDEIKTLADIDSDLNNKISRREFKQFKKNLVKDNKEINIKRKELEEYLINLKDADKYLKEDLEITNITRIDDENTAINYIDGTELVVNSETNCYTVTTKNPKDFSTKVDYYNADGELTKFEETKGAIKKEYDIDENNNPVLVTETRNKGNIALETIITYAYNDNTVVETIQKNDSTQIITKDLEGNVLHEKESKDEIETEISYNYETQTKEISKTKNNVKMTWTQTFDNKNLKQTIEKNNEVYEVEYDGKGNTYVIIQNGEYYTKLRKNFRGDLSNEDFDRLWTDLHGKNYNLRVGKRTTVPTELNANDYRLENRKDPRGAEQDYQDTIHSLVAEFNFTKGNLNFDNPIIVKEGQSLYKVAEESLKEERTLRAPSEAEITIRMAEIMAANDLPNNYTPKSGDKLYVFNNEKKGTYQAYSQTKYNDTLIDNSLDKIFAQYNNKEDAVKYYINKLTNDFKSFDVYCDDIKEFENTVINLKNEENQKKYLKWFTQKLTKRLEKGKRTDFIRTNKFNNIKIDQGCPVVGNCYFLSTVGSLANLKAYRDELSKLIEIDEGKKQVTVKLPLLEAQGKEPYVFSFEQIDAATEFDGEDGGSSFPVRVLEIAAEKFLLEQTNNVDLIKATSAGDEIKSPLDGETSNYALAILFGKDISPLYYATPEIVDQFIENIKADKGVDYKPIIDYLGIQIPEDDSCKATRDLNNLSNALKEDKIITAIRTVFLNKTDEGAMATTGHNPSTDHVMFVTDVDVKNNKITVIDPAIRDKKHYYTLEEFAATFPLVDINNPRDIKPLEIKNPFVKKYWNYMPELFKNLKNKEPLNIPEEMLTEDRAATRNFFNGLSTIIISNPKLDENLDVSELNSIILKNLDQETLDKSVSDILKESSLSQDLKNKIRYTEFQNSGYDMQLKTALAINEILLNDLKSVKRSGNKTDFSFFNIDYEKCSEILNNFNADNVTLKQFYDDCNSNNDSTIDATEFALWIKNNAKKGKFMINGFDITDIPNESFTKIMNLLNNDQYAKENFALFNDGFGIIETLKDEIPNAKLKDCLKIVEKGIIIQRATIRQRESTDDYDKKCDSFNFVFTMFLYSIQHNLPNLVSQYYERITDHIFDKLECYSYLDSHIAELRALLKKVVKGTVYDNKWLFLALDSGINNDQSLKDSVVNWAAAKYIKHVDFKK